MQKGLITIGILIFVLVTVFVLAVDDSSPRKKVQFTNQNLVINNENTEIKTEDLNIDLSQANIQNKQLQSSNKNINLQSNDLKFNNTNTANQNIALNNTNNISRSNNDFHNRDIDFSNEDVGSYKDTKLDKQISDYEKQKSRLKNIENSLKDNRIKNQRTETQNRYMVKNIDWSTWKSNFVNEIIDGSMSIKSLDTYPEGSWFYYSFNVDKDGSISDIKVSSLQISAEDRKSIANLIKSYQYKDITVFPANSKRSRAKVDAIVMLGSSEKKARPSDFNDTERIKIKLP